MTGTQRAYSLLAKKRMNLDVLYQKTPRFFSPTRQVKRADARAALKELQSMEKKRKH